MQSVLEREVRLLLIRLRGWAIGRDRAVLFGALLCCVPFLPVTLLGLLITLGNLLLWRLGKLERAELPVLLFALGMVAIWLLAWWLLYTAITTSTAWLAMREFWRAMLALFWWFRPHGLGLDV